MFVCICNKVTDSQIRQACNDGASSINCLKERLKVATCCGRCEDCAKQVLQDAKAERCSAEPIAATA
jgi:bacterioferritin-associated ferredoxin